ncbi:MAG: proton-conducting transporter membrane subunit, partial [Myxococcales bacterium]
MNNLLVAPIFLPLLAAALGMAAWRNVRVQTALGVVTTFAVFGCAVELLRQVAGGGHLVLRVGGWPAPFGIVLVADVFAALMVLLTSGIAVAVAVFSVSAVDPGRRCYGWYPLMLVLSAGVNLAFLTGDLFNLFVAFELMLIASFVMVSLGGEKAQLEGALKYVTLNLVSSALFLTAVGLVYGMTGTLNLADLAQRLPALENRAMVLASGMLLLAAFGIKAAIFPLFFWLPAAYHTLPPPGAALFAGTLTKVGVYAMVRVFTLLIPLGEWHLREILLATAGLTMVVGVLGAAVQVEMRRILAFHIISQIGYLLMGLAIYAPLALAGMVFFMIHNVLAKSNLFLVSGAVLQIQGSTELKRLGELYRARPLLAVLFLVPALSLAGIPPFSGFFAKLLLVRAGLEIEQ